MVNVLDRSAGVQLIARWMAGRITNFEFDDEWPYKSNDRAVSDVGMELWLHYTDAQEVQLNAMELTVAERQLLSRCLAFLKSTEEYVPVSYDQAKRWKHGMLSWLLGIREPPWETRRLRISSERRDWWPFADRRQFEQVHKDVTGRIQPES